MTRTGTSSARRRSSRSKFAPRLFPLESRALPATFVVTSPLDGGPGTLRDAVLQANGAVGADTIAFDLGPGAHTITLTGGPLTVTDDLTIDGPGAGLLTISGGGNSAVLVAHPAAPPSATTPTIALTVEGLTIADGRASADPDSGGGIFAIQTDLTVANTAFRNNQAAAYGGAIAVYPGLYQDAQGNFVAAPGSLTVSDASFEANTAEVSGGAVAAFDTPSLITESSFDENGVGGGGGAVFTFSFYEPRATLSIGRSSFADNESGNGSGGAVLVSDQSATVSDTAFRGNTAGFGGGAIAYTSTFSLQTSLTVEGGSFEGNAAINPFSFGMGGAIFNGGSLIVRDSRFDGNRVVAPLAAQGGAIHNQFAAEMTVEGSLFRDNLARSDGDVSYAAGGALGGDSLSAITVVGSRFLGNRAEARTVQAHGGAIKNHGSYFPGDVRALTVRDSFFQGNSASGLGPSPWGQGVTAVGGAVYNEGGPVDVSGTTFLDNLAQGTSGGATETGGFAVGGGLATSGGGPLTLSDSLFAGNRAVSGSGGSASLGGGFAVGGALVDQFRFSGPPSTITDTWFVDNAALGGAGLGSGAGGPAWGGGLVIFGNPAVLTDIRVIGNRAVGGDGATGGEGLGGGLFVNGFSVGVADSQFVANRAEGGYGATAGAGRGGAIYGTGADLILDGSQLLANRALGGLGPAGGDAEGGGLWVAGSVTVVDAWILGNLADAGPAGHGYGGGIFLAPGTTFTINKKSKILGNQATTAGNNLYQSP
jgi:predicted outer membrane repeat protein